LQLRLENVIDPNMIHTKKSIKKRRDSDKNSIAEGLEEITFKIYAQNPAPNISII